MSLFRSLLVQSRSSIFNNIGLTLYSGFNTRIKILNNVKSYSALANSTISTSHKNHKEFVNEPGGYFLGLKPGEKLKLDSFQKIFVYFYLGGILLLVILHYYKPDDSPRTWARNEAIKRMKKRGIDVSDIIHDS